MLIQPAGLEEIFRHVNFMDGFESSIQVGAWAAAGAWGAWVGV